MFMGKDNVTNTFYFTLGFNFTVINGQIGAPVFNGSEPACNEQSMDGANSWARKKHLKLCDYSLNR